MAITTDAFLGTGKSHASATLTLTTSSAAASGSVIALFAGRFNSVNTNDMAVTTTAGLTWTKVGITTAATVRAAVWVAVAASGLASSSSIVVTHSGSSPASTDSFIGAESFLGVDQVNPVDGSAGTNNGNGTGWSTGSAGNSGDALVGAAFGDGAQSSSTPTSPAAELWDVNDATQTETFTGAWKSSISGASTVAGTWAASETWAAIAVALLAASGGGGGATVKQLAALGVG